MRVGSGTENTQWLAASKGWHLELDVAERIIYARHGAHERCIPLENVAGWVAWREPTEADRLAALPHVMPPPQRPTAPAPTDGQPRDIRPTVSLRDLGPTARANAEQHGFVMVGDVQHRVVP